MICLRTGMSSVQVNQLVTMTLDIIADSLSNGDPVVFRKFGKFEVQTVQARVGRNPRSPETELVIPAHNRVKFVPCHELRRRVRRILPD